jgi:hypothetical protein
MLAFSEPPHRLVGCSLCREFAAARQAQSPTASYSPVKGHNHAPGPSPSRSVGVSPFETAAQEIARPDRSRASCQYDHADFAFQPASTRSHCLRTSGARPPERISKPGAMGYRRCHYALFAVRPSGFDSFLVLRSEFDDRRIRSVTNRSHKENPCSFLRASPVLSSVAESMTAPLPVYRAPSPHRRGERCRPEPRGPFHTRE